MMYFLTFTITSIIFHCNVTINTYFTKYRMQLARISDALGVKFQVTLCYANANKPLHYTSCINQRNTILLIFKFYSISI